MSEYNIEKLQEIFYLDSSSPSGVAWKIAPTMGNGCGRKYAEIGDTAGYSDGYWRAKHKKIRYNLHRVVYTLAIGNIPKGYVVDHINRNSLDNSIHNLRAVPVLLNNRNRRRYSRNTTNFNGVSLDVKDSKNIYFVSTWYDTSGTKRSKCFPILKLGILEAQVAACLHRKQKINELNLQGAGYTKDHGQE